jgi:hypothetical protein
MKEKYLRGGANNISAALWRHVQAAGIENGGV